MMCQRMGRPPTSTIGLGRNSVSSRNRVPSPPQSNTTFMRGCSWVAGAERSEAPEMPGLRVAQPRPHGMLALLRPHLDRERLARRPEVADQGIRGGQGCDRFGHFSLAAGLAAADLRFLGGEDLVRHLLPDTARRGSGA